MREEYHKSRRNLSLVSGLLIAWALIGIELGSTPFSNFNVELKSPQAAPYILLSLVVFFSFRLIVEWFKGDEGRRADIAERVDFYVAQSLGGVSILVFLVQKAFSVQIAELPGLYSAAPFMSGVLFSFWCMLRMELPLPSVRSKRPIVFANVFYSLLGAALLVYAARTARGDVIWAEVLFLILGIGLGILVNLTLLPAMMRRMVKLVGVGGEAAREGNGEFVAEDET